MHASRSAGDTLPKSPSGRACVASLAMAVASEHGASSSAERTHWNLPGYSEWNRIMGQKLKASLKKGGVMSLHAEKCVVAGGFASGPQSRVEMTGASCSKPP